MVAELRGYRTHAPLESAQNHRIGRDAGPRRRRGERRLRKKGLATKPQGVQLGTAEEAKEEDAKETTQLDHADTEQAAAAKQEQKIAENALEHQPEAEAENHAEEIRRRTPLEVVVDETAHLQKLPQCAVRLKKWNTGAGHFRSPRRRSSMRVASTTRRSTVSPFASRDFQGVR